MKDGWHNIKGRSVYVEDGYIVRAMKANDTLSASVYRYCGQLNVWCKEGYITPSAFASGVRRGTIDIF